MPAATTASEPLTGREREILHMLAEGASNAAVGGTLHLTEGTVKWYNRRIFEKLGARNRAEAVRVYERMQHAVPARKTASPPSPQIHIVGRERERSDLTALIREHRLVTVLGPGGMGKSALALATAQALAPAFADGVLPVALAGLSHPDELPAAIAAGVGLANAGSSVPVDQLLLHLSDKRALLVLDNLDVLVNAAPFVQTLLEAAPAIHVLGTSRERLNLSNEVLFRLGGLDITAPTGSDAAHLFVHHARRVQPDMRLDAPTLGAIARICQAVDGMPLALVLAAGWVDTLSLTQIAHEVTHGLELFSTSLRDMPERHRSMQAVLDHTWARLSTAEQQVFAALCVLRGGFDRDAALAIAQAEMRVLGALNAKSLITFANDRYAIHELVRQHGQAKLATAGKVDASKAAHARHFLTRLDTAVAADFDNVREAWLHAAASQQHGWLDPARLLAYCERLGRYQDAVALCLSALGHAPADALRAQLHFACGSARAVMGDLAVATKDFEHTLALIRRAPVDGLSETQVLTRLGESLRRNGHLHEAMTTLHLAQQHAEAANDVQAQSDILFHLGFAHHYLGHWADMLATFEKCHHILGDTPAPPLVAVQAAYAQANVCMYGGRFADAIVHFERAHELALSTGVLRYACECLEMAGHTAIVVGSFHQAEDFFARATALAERTHMYWMLSAIYPGHGYACAALGDYARGFDLTEKGVALAHKLGLPRFVGLGRMFSARMLLDLGLLAAAREHGHIVSTQLHTTVAPMYSIDIVAVDAMICAREPAATVTALQDSEAALLAAEALFGRTVRSEEIAEALCELAARRKDFGLTAERASQLLAFARERRNPLGELGASQWLGVAELGLGNIDAGLAALSHAQALAQSLGYGAREIVLHRMLADAQVSLGNTDAAGRHRAAAAARKAEIATNLRDQPELRAGLDSL